MQSFDYLKIKQDNIEADYEEYRRLLYVALTRAEDRLYIAGFTKDKDANEQSWYKLLQNNITSNISLPAEDKRIIYKTEQELDFKNAVETQEKVAFDLSKYASLLCPAPIEDPLSKPYMPSHNEDEDTDIASSPLEDDGNFYKRGTAIHKLLQYIFTVPAEKRLDISVAFLKKELPDFSAHQIQQIASEVFHLCEKYSFIFSSDSQAEVPIIGEADGKIISAKIDRLVILPDKVIIIDYKTNRPAAKTLAEVPSLYIKQLHTYRLLLQTIYPQKKIVTYILWTNTCQLMEV